MIINAKLNTYKCIFLKGTIEEWQIVFYVTAAVSLVGGLPYAFFARGEVEQWAILEEKDNAEQSNDSATKSDVTK